MLPIKAFKVTQLDARLFKNHYKAMQLGFWRLVWCFCKFLGNLLCWLKVYGSWWMPVVIHFVHKRSQEMLGPCLLLLQSLVKIFWACNSTTSQIFRHSCIRKPNPIFFFFFFINVYTLLELIYAFGISLHANHSWNFTWGIIQEKQI